MDKPFTVDEIDGLFDGVCDNLDDITPDMPNYKWIRDENLLNKQLIIALKQGYQALADSPCPDCKGGVGLLGLAVCPNCNDFPVDRKKKFAKDWKDAYNRVVKPEGN
jgi:hypothetical protein